MWLLAGAMVWVGIFAAARYAIRTVRMVVNHFTLVTVGIVAMELLVLAVEVLQAGDPPGVVRSR